MPNLKRIKLNRIKDFFKKSLRNMAENCFFTFLGLFILSLILGIVIFTRYSILAEMPAENMGAGKVFKFETKIYQKVLKEWQEKNEIFSQAGTKKYSNPFLH
jgi:hypothetical protein